MRVPSVAWAYQQRFGYTAEQATSRMRGAITALVSQRLIDNSDVPGATTEVNMQIIDDRELLRLIESTRKQAERAGKCVREGIFPNTLMEAAPA